MYTPEFIEGFHLIYFYLLKVHLIQKTFCGILVDVGGVIFLARILFVINFCKVLFGLSSKPIEGLNFQNWIVYLVNICIQ